MGKYFKKELIAFEEFHKVRQLKFARVKYNNRISQKPPMGSLVNNLDLQPDRQNSYCEPTPKETRHIKVSMQREEVATGKTTQTIENPYTALA